MIVVNRDGSEHAALEAFKRGAADCVVAGEEFADVLPVVALEQIQRWRAARDQGVAERRIRDLESYNQNIIQNLNSALLVVDLDGKIAFSNPPAEEILGESAEALRGRLIWPWFEGIPRDEIHVARTLETGERFKGLESTLTRADGTAVPIGISSAPVFDSAGTKLGAVAVFSDLTEIKLLQRKVLQTEKMASIGQLAAGVAHEINNPMGFIHANLFQMSEYLTDLHRVWDEVVALQAAVAGGDPADIRRSSGDLAVASKKVDVDFVLSDFAKAIRESQEGSERIRHIVNDLRNFSHRDSEYPVLADVNQFLDSTAGIVWPMMKHLVVLEKEYRDLPSVLLLSDAAPAGVHEFAGQRLSGDRGANRGQRRNRGNLVANGTQGGRRGDHREGHRGRDPGRESGPDLRSVLYHQEGGDGHGAGSFDLFQHRRAARRQSRGRKPARCRDCVHGMASRRGIRGGRRVTADVAKQRPTLLIVDDEAQILSALERSLRREDYEIVAVESAAAALRILGERCVDAILSDQKMPGMSGVQLLARAAEMRPDIVRMLITGWVNEIPLERLEEVGICALVTKPWDDAKLKATLRAVMGVAQVSSSPEDGLDTPDQSSDYSLRR